MLDGVDPPPDLVNVVMLFVDADGRRWLAGAWMGPLCAEGDEDVQLNVLDTLDRVLVLSSFKVVRRAEDGG